MYHELVSVLSREVCTRAPRARTLACDWMHMEIPAVFLHGFLLVFTKAESPAEPGTLCLWLF